MMLLMRLLPQKRFTEKLRAKRQKATRRNYITQTGLLIISQMCVHSTIPYLTTALLFDIRGTRGQERARVYFFSRVLFFQQRTHACDLLHAFYLKDQASVMQHLANRKAFTLLPFTPQHRYEGTPLPLHVGLRTQLATLRRGFRYKAIARQDYSLCRFARLQNTRLPCFPHVWNHYLHVDRRPCNVQISLDHQLIGSRASNFRFATRFQHPHQLQFRRCSG